MSRDCINKHKNGQNYLCDDENCEGYEMCCECIECYKDKKFPVCLRKI